MGNRDVILWKIYLFLLSVAIGESAFGTGFTMDFELPRVLVLSELADPLDYYAFLDIHKNYVSFSKWSIENLTEPSRIESLVSDFEIARLAEEDHRIPEAIAAFRAIATEQKHGTWTSETISIFNEAKLRLIKYAKNSDETEMQAMDYLKHNLNSGDYQNQLARLQGLSFSKNQIEKLRNAIVENSIPLRFTPKFARNYKRYYLNGEVGRIEPMGLIRIPAGEINLIFYSDSQLPWQFKGESANLDVSKIAARNLLAGSCENPGVDSSLKRTPLFSFYGKNCVRFKSESNNWTDQLPGKRKLDLGIQPINYGLNQSNSEPSKSTSIFSKPLFWVATFVIGAVIYSVKNNQKVETEVVRIPRATTKR